jgi:peptidoglycan/xylan/chitin deacetylase (PgdA/CDA1 family)
MSKKLFALNRNHRALKPGLLGMAALALIGLGTVCSYVGHADPLPSTDRPAAIAPNKLSAPAALALVRSVRDPYWRFAQVATEGDDHQFMLDRYELERGMHHQMLLEGDTDRKEIALTFDDGPHPGDTMRMLAILKRYHVKATFFLVGKMAEQYPELVQAEAADGDCIGNHTYNHVSLPKIPQEYVGTEIKACGEVLHSITDRDPHLFRPPGGDFDPMVAETAESLGYTTVLWTDDPGDYASPGTDVILSRTLDKATPGGIILLHDGPEQTLEALPQIIQILRERGFQFVTIDQMIAEKEAHKDLVPSAVLADKY